MKVQIEFNDSDVEEGNEVAAITAAIEELKTRIPELVAMEESVVEPFGGDHNLMGVIHISEK